MSEHDEQVKFFQLVDMYKMAYPELDLIFAVPNAGKRSMGALQYYLDEGLRPGVPDIFIPIAKGIYTGLVIEMKFGNGRLSPDQHAWSMKLILAGWNYLLAWDGIAAFVFVCDYLNLPIRLDPQN